MYQRYIVFAIIFEFLNLRSRFFLELYSNIWCGSNKNLLIWT
jgi:hypothetical protein